MPEQKGTLPGSKAETEDQKKKQTEEVGENDNEKGGRKQARAMIQEDTHRGTERDASRHADDAYFNGHACCCGGLHDRISIKASSPAHRTDRQKDTTAEKSNYEKQI